MIREHRCYCCDKEKEYDEVVRIKICFECDTKLDEIRYWEETIKRFDDIKYRSNSQKIIDIQKQKIKKLQYILDTLQKRRNLPIDPLLKQYIHCRDGFICQICKKRNLTGIDCQCDHVIPRSEGGTNEFSNLQTLCRDCNAKKGSTILGFLDDGELIE